MKHILPLFFCLAFNISFSNVPLIARLAKQILTQTCPQAGNNLQRELSKTSAKQLSCTNTLFLIMNALLQIPCPVATHGQHIPSTYPMHYVPGYLDNLRIIAANHYHESIVKGYSYELERALELINEGHEILHFQYKLTDGSISRTVDIHTDKCMVECKNIKWPNCYNESLFRQFSDQHKLVKHYNKAHDTHLYYQVSSKQKISEKWKTWFIKQQIDTHESDK